MKEKHNIAITAKNVTEFEKIESELMKLDSLIRSQISKAYMSLDILRVTLTPLYDNNKKIYHPNNPYSIRVCNNEIIIGYKNILFCMDLTSISNKDINFIPISHIKPETHNDNLENVENVAKHYGSEISYEWLSPSGDEWLKKTGHIGSHIIVEVENKTIKNVKLI